MRYLLRSSSIAFVALSLPFVANAQSITSVTTLISALINYAIGILIGVAIIVFFYGLIRFVLAKDGAEQKKVATRMMINGVIAIAVMLSIYGLVRLLQNTFGVGNNATIPPPSVGQLQITQN